MKGKKILIIAGILLCVGLVVFIAGFAMLGFDINAMTSNGGYNQRSCSTTDEINTVRISDNNADITMTASTDDECHITCMENDNSVYDISTANGVLTVTNLQDKEWIDYFFDLSFTRPILTVALPKGFGGEINAATSNGSITMSDAATGEIELKTSNGSITITNTESKDITATTSNGAISVSAVTSGNMKLKTSNGRITVLDTVSKDISSKTSNGRIEINTVTADTLTTETRNGGITVSDTCAVKDISADTSNHSIKLDRVSFGGRLDCHTGNGSITGTVIGSLGDFSFDCGTSNGDCNLPTDISGGAKTISAHTSNGDIKIDFTD